MKYLLAIATVIAGMVSGMAIAVAGDTNAVLITPYNSNHHNQSAALSTQPATIKMTDLSHLPSSTPAASPTLKDLATSINTEQQQLLQQKPIRPLDLFKIPDLPSGVKVTVGSY